MIECNAESQLTKLHYHLTVVCSNVVDLEPSLISYALQELGFFGLVIRLNRAIGRQLLCFNSSLVLDVGYNDFGKSIDNLCSDRGVVHLVGNSLGV